MLRLMKWFLVVGGIGMTCVALAEAMQYFEWPPVNEVKYYEGKITAGGKTYRFRTQNRKVLLPGDSQVTVTAYSPAGRTPRKVTKSGKQVTPPPVVKEEKKVKPPPRQTSDYAEIPYKEDHGYKDTTKEGDDSGYQFFKSDKKTKSVERDMSKEWRSLLSLHQSFGQEKLTAKGGVSDFDAKSVNIAGVLFRGTVQPPRKLPWLFELEIGGHNFETTTREQSTLVTTTTEEKKQFLRVYGVLAGYRNLGGLIGLGQKKQFLGAGAGLGYYRLPVMTVSDASTGSATLGLKTAYGPLLGLYYLYTLDFRQTWGAFFRYMPMALGSGIKSSSRNMTFEGFWRYLLDEGVSLGLGLGMRQDSIQKAIDCPETAVNCEPDSVSKSTLFQIRAGVGLML